MLKKISVIVLFLSLYALLNARAPLALVDYLASHLNYDIPGAQYVDLTWGAVAIESGFIHNLRFYGNYEITLDSTTGKRVYAMDKTKDPLFAIIRQLFPSTGGVLAAAVNRDQELCNELSCVDVVKIIKHFFYDAQENLKVIAKGVTKKRTKFINNVISPFLQNIQAIVDGANRNGSETIEKHKKEVLAQVLLAFLYEKISVQNLGDINALMEEFCVFADPYANEAPPRSPSEEWSRKAREHLKNMWENNPFPYISEPISQGFVNVIDNSGSQLKHTFPDCVEVLFRHVFNILFYDPRTGDFTPNHIHIMSPRADLLRTFYQTHQPNRDSANNGSQALRTEWNKIMVGIPNVIYRMKTDGSRLDPSQGADLIPYKSDDVQIASNEIKAGIINVYNILAFLFGKEQIIRDCTSEQKLYESICDQNDQNTAIIVLKEKLLNLFQESEHEGAHEDDTSQPQSYRFGITELEISMTNFEADKYDIYADVTIRGVKQMQQDQQKKYQFDIHILKGHGNIALGNLGGQNTIGLFKDLGYIKPLFAIENSLRLFYDGGIAGLCWLYQGRFNSLETLLRFVYRLKFKPNILSYPDSFKQSLAKDIDNFASARGYNTLMLNDNDIKEEGFLDTIYNNTWPLDEVRQRRIATHIQDVVTTVNFCTNQQNAKQTLNFSGLSNIETINIIASETKTMDVKIICSELLTIDLNGLPNLETLKLSFSVGWWNWCTFWPHVYYNISCCQKLRTVEIDNGETIKINLCSQLRSIKTNLSRSNITLDNPENVNIGKLN
ncbi:MAG: hypothetical protein LBH52_03300 [Puniceicoccales bacterium]|nr:hypothetical protein [Puniceicoccales bacterium]